jgi:hypothetical protein
MVIPKLPRIMRITVPKIRILEKFWVKEVTGRVDSMFREYIFTTFPTILLMTMVAEKMPETSRNFPNVSVMSPGMLEILIAKYIASINSQMSEGPFIAEMITSSRGDVVFPAQFNKRLNRIFLAAYPARKTTPKTIKGIEAAINP